MQFLEKPIRLDKQIWDKWVVPLVSISCITYNHENFISDAIEGFLMQETTFPVEINIHEDASTDNTAKIIREYEKKYPNVLFNVIYQTENQYSKKDGSIRRIQHGRARGKYYAICEGDDYWIDPLKLQKQVNFLEENPDYILSFTGCNFLFEEKKKIAEPVKKNIPSLASLSKEKLFFAIINDKLRIQTASVVLRKNYLQELKNDKKFKMGDKPVWLTFSQFGKFHYLDEPSVVYRVSRGTATRPESRRKKVEFKVSGFLMRFYYIKKFNYKIPNTLLKDFEKYIIDHVKLGGAYNSNLTRYLSSNTIDKIKRLEQRAPLINKIDYYFLNPRVLAFDLKEKIVIKYSNIIK